MRIGSHDIGGSNAVYVIAEIGGNHDNDYDQALDLILAAAKAGAQAAKFQFFNPETLYPGRHTIGSIPKDWLKPLKDFTEDAQLDFICSVFDEQTLEDYLAVDPVAIKIASPEATNYDLIYAAHKTGLPVLISTGACTVEQVAILATPYPPADNYALLHCVSAYPADPAELNLRAITVMANHFDFPIGFSDHATTDFSAAFAVAAGACIIEKHLTLNRRLTGPDHHYALEPASFKAMVHNIRQLEPMLGDGVKRPMPSEDPTDRR